MRKMLPLPYRGSTIQLAVALLLLLSVTSRADWRSRCPRGCRCTQNAEEHLGLNLASCKGVSSVPALGPETQAIRIRDSEFGRVPDSAFQQFKNLIYLSIRMSNVLEIEPDAFAGLEALEHLLLSHNLVENLDNRTFQTNKMLRTLGLNDNRMEKVDDRLFWNNSLLEILDLSNNRIHSINPEAFKQNRKLYFLNLSGNNLTHVDVAILSEMPNLRIFQLDDNPWHCDCRLTPLREWFVGKSVDLTQTRCHEPETLRGRPWSEIKSEEFVCSP